ncbi:Serine/threonine-protein kinase EDR1 [Linum grandiflorum]
MKKHIVKGGNRHHSMDLTAAESLSRQLWSFISYIATLVHQLVTTHMAAGGTVKDANLPMWMEKTTELSTVFHTSGSIHISLSRRRALLYKVLADTISLPYRLAKGGHHTDAVNIIKSEDGREFLVDLMAAPETLIPAIPGNAVGGGGGARMNGSEDTANLFNMKRCRRLMIMLLLSASLLIWCVTSSAAAAMEADLDMDLHASRLVVPDPDKPQSSLTVFEGDTRLQRPSATTISASPGYSDGNDYSYLFSSLDDGEGMRDAVIDPGDTRLQRPSAAAISASPAYSDGDELLDRFLSRDDGGAMRSISIYPGDTRLQRPSAAAMSASPAYSDGDDYSELFTSLDDGEGMRGVSNEEEENQ